MTLTAELLVKDKLGTNGTLNYIFPSHIDHIDVSCNILCYVLDILRKEINMVVNHKR